MKKDEFSNNIADIETAAHLAKVAAQKIGRPSSEIFAAEATAIGTMSALISRQQR